MSLLVFPLFLVATPQPTLGQDITSQYGKVVLSPGAKGEALITALRFSSELNADSVGIAGCRTVDAVSEDDFRLAVQPVLAGRILEPKPRPGEPSLCAVWEFQEEGKTRLFVEDVVQIRRESNGVLPYPERLAFEVRLQVLKGRGYREWHQVTVRPTAFDMEGEIYKVASWRVIRYEVTGWEWMHDYSASGGPIR